MEKKKIAEVNKNVPTEKSTKLILSKEDLNLFIKIIKNINISTLLLLKLYDELSKKIYVDKLITPIQILCFECGLLNCYISKDYKIF